MGHSVNKEGETRLVLFQRETEIPWEFQQKKCTESVGNQKASKFLWYVIKNKYL